MANTPPIKVTRKPYRIGTREGYKYWVEIKGTMSYAEFTAAVAKAVKLTQAQVQGAFDYGRELSGKEAARQIRVDIGFGDVYLTGHGSLKDPNESVAGRKDVLGVTIQTATRLNDIVRNLEVVDDTKSVALHIWTVLEEGHPDQGNKLFASGSTVVITTNCGQIDANREDEGVWLINASGEKVATAAVTSSQPGYSVVTFTELPEPGQYTLVYACRNGEDASEYTPAVDTRKVTVVAG